MKIQMFGNFRMTWEGGVLQSSPRTKKVWLLLEYLLLMRRQQVSQDELIHLLWNQEECDHPVSALKNIIYRARKLLREALGEGEYLCSEDGCYFWNPEYPCTVDCEELERLAAEAAKAPPEKQYELLQQACALYQGDFLSKMDFSEWVLAQRRKYEEIYVAALLQLGEVQRREGRFEERVRLGERLIAEKPEREEFHCLLIGAYLDAGCRQKALACCDSAVRRFEGTSAAERIRQFYAKALPEQNSIDSDFSALREMLRDAEGEIGAFFCTFDLFRNIYRLQTRLLLRDSHRLCLFLLSLGGTDGQPGSRRFVQAVEGMKETLIVGLRRGDVVSQYAENKFVLLLVLRDESDGELVVNRLKRIFSIHYPDLQVDLQTRFSQVEPIEEIH